MFGLLEGIEARDHQPVAFFNAVYEFYVTDAAGTDFDVDHRCGVLIDDVGKLAAARLYKGTAFDHQYIGFVFEQHSGGDTLILPQADAVLVVESDTGNDLVIVNLWGYR